ncbi:sensor histidine kinase YesM [Microbacterium phyllosphaerae]|uniref:Sensor histidine kinase YesM n=1 Tax=Microbacterium phyllosphaerae TaxID=124798 RepID=A0ABS4WMV1_9MICO|nr:sensor histidine kinase YesM [Microbacterium phyllosphaerae]
MDPEALRELLTDGAEGLHIGLRNVDTRLRQLYGTDGGLVVETNTGAGTLVRMRVPKSQPLHDPDND